LHNSLSLLWKLLALVLNTLAHTFGTCTMLWIVSLHIASQIVICMYPPAFVVLTLPQQAKDRPYVKLAIPSALYMVCPLPQHEQRCCHLKMPMEKCFLSSAWYPFSCFYVSDSVQGLYAAMLCISVCAMAQGLFHCSL